MTVSKRPLLIVMGGLPGSGKTTVSRLLAERLKGTYIRIDTLEQALRNAGAMDNGPEGYAVGYAIAEENLRAGNIVIADSVNSLPITRNAWREIAARTSATLLEIEVICSDKAEHKRRVEARQPDIPGQKVPTWQAVLDREYHPWNTKNITVDTAKATPEAVLENTLEQLAPYLKKAPK